MFSIFIQNDKILAAAVRKKQIEFEHEYEHDTDNN